MSTYPSTDTPSNLVDRAAAAADQALEGFSSRAHHLQEEATHLSQRGVNAVRETAQQVRERALKASEDTRHYVKDEPIKALLIAAATGAALVALISLMSRSRH